MSAEEQLLENILNRLSDLESGVSEATAQAATAAIEARASNHGIARINGSLAEHERVIREHAEEIAAIKAHRRAFISKESAVLVFKFAGLPFVGLGLALAIWEAWIAWQSL